MLTNEQIRDGFNQVIAQTTNPAAVARMELAREFFTNPNFRKSLEDYTWQKTK